MARLKLFKVPSASAKKYYEKRFGIRFSTFVTFTHQSKTYGYLFEQVSRGYAAVAICVPTDWDHGSDIRPLHGGYGIIPYSKKDNEDLARLHNQVIRETDKVYQEFVAKRSAQKPCPNLISKLHRAIIASEQYFLMVKRCYRLTTRHGRLYESTAKKEFWNPLKNEKHTMQLFNLLSQNVWGSCHIRLDGDCFTGLPVRVVTTHFLNEVRVSYGTTVGEALCRAAIKLFTNQKG